MHPDTSIKQDFEREWASFYANRRPLGWLLRSDQSLAWVRFHSLPNSKRYPENKAEKDIILSRAHSLANETLGADASCWQIECRKEEVNPPYWDVVVSGTAAKTFADDDETRWCASVLETRWRQGTLDYILLAIANDKTGPTMWMDRKTGRIFAPYDGGFDLLVSSPEEVKQLRIRFGDWLSDHPEGL
ncbi:MULTISPECIES: hypothetical protein [unclassified Rhizobium]|uniref:DUF3885 domain-containing protein n=1 Tax=unclassified Rhizobium TaxID=2613769 RepID=UPI0038090DEC